MNISIYQKASILTGLGNTKPSHIKLGINSCRTKSVANSIKKIIKEKIPKIVFALIIQLFCLFHGPDANPQDKNKYNSTVSNIHKTVFQMNISKDNLKNAVNQCKSALKNYPKSAEIYLYLAIAHYRLGEFTNSFSIIKKGKRILTTQINKNRQKNKKYPIKTKLLLEIKEFEKLILGRLKQERYRLNLKKEYLLKGRDPSSE